jgi:DNA helicase II / ATP-dependent DNA helicase PcrA
MTTTQKKMDRYPMLNPANISFLRSVVAPPNTRTVMCAVGDPAQAIYAFRGADPDALQRYGTAFRAQWMYLTYCFRCPRRIVFLASHLCSAICYQKTAPMGSVRVLVSAHPWKTLVDCVSIHQRSATTTLFLARNNRTVLMVLNYLYQTVDRIDGIHWLSPGIERELRTIMDVHEYKDTNLGERLKLATLATERHNVTATERIIHSILQMAVQIEGMDRQMSESLWLKWLADVLDSDKHRHRALTVGTIHAVKGEEWPHVVIHDFNLFGHGEDTEPTNQDRNLLYIAITRAKESVTFLLTQRTKHVRSPLLPIDIVHYSGELWCDES